MLLQQLCREEEEWFNIDRNERYCILCNINEIGDEFHILFEYDNLRDHRNIFLASYFITLILSSSLCCLISKI